MTQKLFLADKDFKLINMFVKIWKKTDNVEEYIDRFKREFGRIKIIR